MHKAFQELFRLIRKAKRALYLDPPCMVTTQAYLKMAEVAAYDLLDHAFNENYNCLRNACNYSQKFCLQEKSWEIVVDFLENFWIGVQDGFFNRRQKKDRSEYYKTGFEIIRYGK